MWQAEARTRDEAHKAELRAHVERPVPPITREGLAAIKLAGAAHLAIRHVFPPRLPQRSMSFFGGKPIAPDELDWPLIHNRAGLLERLNFMAQIDLSDLPAGPARHLFPETGVLYFFAPMSDTFGPDAAHFTVRYVPGPATRSWRPLDVTAAEIQRNDPTMKVWRGDNNFARAEIEFAWIEEPTDAEVAARAGEGYAFQVAEKISAERLDAFYGPTPPHDPLLSAHTAPKDVPWIPYPDFPANWKTARILARLADAHHRQEVADVEARIGRLGEIADDDPEVQRLRALREALSRFRWKMSAALDPAGHGTAKDHEAPPAEVKQKILAFIEELRVDGMPSSREIRYVHQQLPRILATWLETAAIHGAEAGLNEPDGAALIPASVVTALARRHAARGHQMLGEGVVVQEAADRMKERYLLLLQLGPDPALDWLIGEMGPLQYWITPEDLAAKRFENAVLTIEAY